MTWKSRQPWRGVLKDKVVSAGRVPPAARAPVANEKERRPLLGAPQGQSRDAKAGESWWPPIRSIKTLARHCLHAQPTLGHAGRNPISKILGAAIEELRFASDSPLEGAGFEPSVPRLG